MSGERELELVRLRFGKDSRTNTVKRNLDAVMVAASFGKAVAGNS